MIKVVQLQWFSESTGRAALRLHRAFLNNGVSSTIISMKRGVNDDEKIIQKGKIPKLIARIDSKLQSYLLRNRLKEFGLFSYPLLGSDVSKMKEIREADYIYIHWALGGFLNISNFEQLAKLGKPVIFFLHDMWAITGGCHQNFTCEKYKSHCSDCQFFSKTKYKDLAFKEFEKKISFYLKYNNLYFISPSKWLYGCTKESYLTRNKPVFYIPNLLDNSLFKPFDKRLAKQILNIGPDEIVISFGAASIDSPYKGWKYLVEGLNILYKEGVFKNISLLIFGSGNKKAMSKDIPFRTRFTGFLSDEYSTVLVYNAADVFIAPSLADNLPTTVLESLSCGTPVVGFEVGGIPDMIKHKKNGYLAKYKDAYDISEGIKYCLENNIKGHNLPDFKPETIINKHLEVFDYIQKSEEKLHIK